MDGAVPLAPRVVQQHQWHQPDAQAGCGGEGENGNPLPLHSQHSLLLVTEEKDPQVLPLVSPSPSPSWFLPSPSPSIAFDGSGWEAAQGAGPCLWEAAVSAEPPLPPPQPQQPAAFRTAPQATYIDLSRPWGSSSLPCMQKGAPLPSWREANLFYLNPRSPPTVSVKLSGARNRPCPAEGTSNSTA